MKRTPAVALFVLSCLGVAARVVAQEPAVGAKVPFEFTVGGKLLPADTYTITSSSPGVVMIQSADKHFTAVTTASHGNQQSADGSKLVFAKYGDQYFLHRILCPATASMNVDIPKSKVEKRVQRQEAMVNGGEPVLVAAR
jgi:hypothetical protein